MHSKHRELNTKYVRTCKDLDIANQIRVTQTKENDEMHMKISDLQKELVVKESVINHLNEKQQSLGREIEIKA